MLTIRNLEAGYEQQPVVKVSDLSLADGEHCLIYGKSGSGKTTLLYAIAGLLKPLAGDIIIHESNITLLSAVALDRFRSSHIGIVHQTLHMVASLSVLDNILLPSYAAGIKQDSKRAEMLLEQLDVFSHRHKKPHELSQGQLQRVAITRAAMNNPKLILGDEPTSALDDKACEAVMTLLLATAKASGASLVVATHDARITKYFSKTITLGGAL